MSLTLLRTHNGSITLLLDPGSLMLGVAARRVGEYLAVNVALGPVWLVATFRI